MEKLTLLRLSEVLKIIPVGKSTWWAKVKSGEFPQPVKLSGGITTWRLSDIERLVEGETNFAKK